MKKVRTMPRKVKLDESLPEEKKDDLWLLNFSLEASARYHEARRARLESYVAIVKVVSIVGAVLAFVFVSGEYPDISGYKIEYIIGVLAATIAFINLLDLVFNVDGRARLHTDLYRRYKAIQETIARDSGSWEQHLNDWKAAARAIEIDEPPVFYALYVDYWNLAVDKFGAEKKFLREIKGWQRRLRHYRHFQPKDFPPHGA